MADFQAYLNFALDPRVRMRATWVAIVVGSILNVINQGDAFLSLQVNWVKVVATYLVPYCVATHSAASLLLDQSRHP